MPTAIVVISNYSDTSISPVVQVIAMAEPNSSVKVIKDEEIKIYKESGIQERENVHLMTSDDEELSIKARRAGDALGDLFDSALDRTSQAVKSKAKDLLTSGKLERGYVQARRDANDIGRLGPRMVTDLVRQFEDTMTLIAEHEYEDQVRLLTGYKKLVEEQTSVIDSRIHFAKRVH